MSTLFANTVYEHTVCATSVFRTGVLGKGQEYSEKKKKKKKKKHLAHSQAERLVLRALLDGQYPLWKQDSDTPVIWFNYGYYM